MKDRFRRILCAVLAACLFLLFPPVRAEQSDVLMLQKRLLALGFEIGGADGVLGAKTRAAVLLAQTILADEGFSVTPSGYPDAETVSQIIFAVFVGFTLVILFRKGKSLVPCIVFHSVFNALSVIANDEAMSSAIGGPVHTAVILTVASAAVLGGYTVWNWKHLEE